MFTFSKAFVIGLIFSFNLLSEVFCDKLPTKATMEEFRGYRASRRRRYGLTTVGVTLALIVMVVIYRMIKKNV